MGSYDVFKEHGDFIKKSPVDQNGNFADTTISPDTRVRLKFVFIDSRGNIILEEWAGVDDIGIPASEYEEVTPIYAKIYDTGYDTATSINFRLCKNIDEITSLVSSGQFSLARADKDFDEPASRKERRDETRILNLRPIPQKKVFTELNVTMSWESSLTGEEEGKYYYLFNREKDFEITKRTAPRGRPLRVKTVTSQMLIGNHKLYYCHVARVDKRGRIRATSSTEFMVDTVPPLHGTVIVPKTTTDLSIPMIAGATGAIRLYISNINYGEGGKWEDWSQEKLWRLLDGSGIKKLYVMFKDVSGNTSKAFITTEIVDPGDPGDGDGLQSITINTDSNGTVALSGNSMIANGEDLIVTILPNQGYEPDKIRVDGREVSLSEDNRYKFINIQKDYVMDISFRPVPTTSFVINASAGICGSIFPAGQIKVNPDSNIIFTITPVAGYKIAGLEVDGKPAELTDGNSYVFTNISENHSIKAKFE